jgi:hypothetical protein
MFRYLANQRSWSEECVIKKLISEYLPRKLQIIFYSIGVALEAAIERIAEIEVVSNLKDVGVNPMNNKINEEKSGFY